MKCCTDTRINLLVNQIRDLHHSDSEVQRITEHSKLRQNIPELKSRVANTAKKPSGKFEVTKIYIKNMVSIRCKMVVKAVLENLGLYYTRVELGEAKIIGKISEAMLEQLKSSLMNYGLELLENKKFILVEKIKRIIIEMIHYRDEQIHLNFSDYLSEKLNHNYTYLSNLFSEVKGMSIQHFILSHKVERVKELLVYDEFSLSEIAWKLHYSSVAHLSNQFKKITGLTPSHFKNMKHKRRFTLENI